MRVGQACMDGVVMAPGTFQGKPVVRVEVEGEPCVVVRPIVERLGLDWDRCLAQIMDERVQQHMGRPCRWWSWWVRLPCAAPAAGPPGPYRVEVVIRARDLAAWAREAQALTPYGRRGPERGGA